jgi:hypothetical protein
MVKAFGKKFMSNWMSHIHLKTKIAILILICAVFLAACGVVTSYPTSTTPSPTLTSSTTVPLPSTTSVPSATPTRCTRDATRGRVARTPQRACPAIPLRGQANARTFPHREDVPCEMMSRAVEPPCSSNINLG